MNSAQSASTAAAGWHPDPHTPGHLRWWDGMQWTHHVQPAPAAAQPAPAHTQQSWEQTAQPAQSFGQAYAQQSAAAVPAYSQESVNASIGAGSAGSLIERNKLSVVSLAVAGAYLLLAMSTGLYIAGVVPAMFAYRSFQRGEQLAPLAALAAAGTVALFVTHFN